MELDAEKMACLVGLALVMAVVTVAAVRGDRGARQAIRAWAAASGLFDVRLQGTSLRPHPQIGTARTGDLTYRMRAVKHNGQLVSGFVKCNALRRHSAMAATIEAKFVRTSVGPRGFPVAPLVDGDTGE